MKSKTLRLKRSDEKLIEKVGLERIEAELDHLELPDHTEKARPLRIRMPSILYNCLDELSELSGVSRMRLLIKAAQEYRRQHPWESDWEEPGPFYENAEKSLQLLTLRLHEDERELIRNLGRGYKNVPHRSAAFEKLVPILQEMRSTLPRKSSNKRVTLNLKLSDDFLEKAERHVELGHSFASVIISAAELAYSST